MSEIPMGFKWLSATLKADSTLASFAPGGIRRGMAKPGTETPYIVMSFQSGFDVVTANATRVMTDALYLVKAVGPTTKETGVFSASNRIDELLDRKNQLVPGNEGWVLCSYRVTPVLYDEAPDGNQLVHSGGTYHLIITRSL